MGPGLRSRKTARSASKYQGMDEAAARLKKIGQPSESMAKAEAILLRLKFSVPAHNILLFKAEKEAFDEAAAAAEK